MGNWGDARIVKADAAREVATLKRQSGKHMIIWGSISVAQSLIDERLIDEYRLVSCPVVRGSGRLLFRDKGQSLDMKLSSAKALDRGAVLLKYAPRDGWSAG